MEKYFLSIWFVQSGTVVVPFHFHSRDQSVSSKIGKVLYLCHSGCERTRKITFPFSKMLKKPEMRKSNALVTVSQHIDPVSPFTQPTHLWGSGRQRYGGAVYSGRSYLAAIVIEKKLRNILNITHEWSTVVVRRKCDFKKKLLEEFNVNGSFSRETEWQWPNSVFQFAYPGRSSKYQSGMKRDAREGVSFVATIFLAFGDHLNLKMAL